MKTLDILDRLIGFPTVSKDSNLDLIDWVEDLLKGADFEVTRIWSPDRQKAGLFARIGPRVEGGVCLSAHTDVVPVEGQNWTRPPFQLTMEDGRVYGRGTTDMKGFLASALATAIQSRAYEKPLTLAISYDEEVGCTGIQHMLPEIAPRIGTPEIVIVGEPTSMRVATGHKGKMGLQVTCRGTPGHSAEAPHFTNAIHIAAAFVTEIRALQEKIAAQTDPRYGVPYTTLHVGAIHGGRALNVVPDEVELAMEFRHLPDQNPETLLAEITSAARRVEGMFKDAEISFERRISYPGFETSADAPAVSLLRSMQGANDDMKVSYGTEAGFLASLGLTCAVIGPGEMTRDGHRPDEGLDIAQLESCDTFLEGLSQRLL